MDLLLGVFLFALIFVPLALIAWACIRAFRNRNVWTEGSSELPWPPGECAGRLLAAMTSPLQRQRYRLSNQGDDAIVFSKTYRPIWLLIPCLLFFPLGLISLLYSKTVDMTFSFQGQTSRTTIINYAGKGPPQLQREIEAGLEQSH